MTTRRESTEAKRYTEANWDDLPSIAGEKVASINGGRSTHDGFKIGNVFRFICPSSVPAVHERRAMDESTRRTRLSLVKMEDVAALRQY